MHLPRVGCQYPLLVVVAGYGSAPGATPATVCLHPWFK